MADVLRLGALKPRAYRGSESERNVEEAGRCVEAAAALGVDLLSFPETYPGPYREDVRYESVEPVRRAAARTGVTVVTGTTTKTAHGSGRYHVEVIVVDGDGEIRGRYNWRTMVRARAIENLMVTATSVHLFPPEFLGDDYPHTGTGSGLTAGHAMICTPERVVAQTHEPGILTADVDLGRIRRLRAAEEVLEVPAPFRTLPGVLRWPRDAMIDAARGANVDSS